MKKKTLTPSQREIAKNFLLSVQKIRKELTTEDNAAIDDLQSGKYKPVYENRAAEL